MRGLPGALSTDPIVLKGLPGAQGAPTKIALLQQHQRINNNKINNSTPSTTKPTIATIINLNWLTVMGFCHDIYVYLLHGKMGTCEARTEVMACNNSQNKVSCRTCRAPSMSGQFCITLIVGCYKLQRFTLQ